LAKKDSAKYIFISGGVLSGLGKGVTAAALGSLLQTHGLKISNIKCENYLNVDSGTINPIEHGDPFLCDDGLEADMDLGTYERFLGNEMGHENFTTMGQVYKSVIDRERNMGYNGEDVEAIPHVVEEIIARIEAAGKDSDVCLVELGGTAGEYQNALYYEAARTMKLQKGSSNVINIHVSYLPFPPHIGEPKTMPTQMSVRTLMSMGVHPDFLVLRGQADVDERRRYLLGLKTSVPGDRVINAPDIDTIYELPLVFAEQKFDAQVLEVLDLKPKKGRRLTDWKQLVNHIKKEKKNKITVGIIGKYFTKNRGDYFLTDAYYALIEAINHAAWEEEVEVDLQFISSEAVETDGVGQLADLSGIIVPIGWGSRGAEGKIEAIRYARENNIPYLGLCFGMQLAAVEFARNVVGLKDAHTTEIDPKTEHPIIHEIPSEEKYQTIKGEGVSMRLGAYDCIIKKNTLTEMIYKKYRQGRLIKSGEKKEFKADGEFLISERHRHRYEFNNEFRERLEEKGLVISGTSPDDFFVESIELPKEKHPFFFATQAHPEYKSTPHKPHPIFLEYLAAVNKAQNKIA
jgi:CTP synthase